MRDFILMASAYAVIILLAALVVAGTSNNQQERVKCSDKAGTPTSGQQCPTKSP